MGRNEQASRRRMASCHQFRAIVFKHQVFKPPVWELRAMDCFALHMVLKTEETDSTTRSIPGGSVVASLGRFSTIRICEGFRSIHSGKNMFLKTCIIGKYETK